MVDLVGVCRASDRTFAFQPLVSRYYIQNGWERI